MDAEPTATLVVERPPQPEGAVATADLAECTCPDFCERDHEND
ncbi:MAG TPA: hypothetical protein VLW05_08040 [Gaiellaceae bacterium]|nr:hypothetical protein [Gaiellaceae bacterium]